MEIHPTAIVSARARLPERGRIGPYCVIEEDVEIGEGTELDSHVVLYGGTRLGRDCRLHAAAVLGQPAVAVAMMANELAKRGQEIPAGTFIMTGGVTEAIPVEAGDSVTVRFQDLGTVSMRFV